MLYIKQFHRIFSPSLITAIILLIPSGLKPQIQGPVVKEVPEIEFNISESSERYKVKITMYGKEPVEGEIILGAGASIYPSGNSGIIYPFRNISRITVNMWNKSKKGSGCWIFYPEGYEIILKDNSRVSHRGNIAFLNRIRFVEGKKKQSYIYTYFYDYYKNGKWVNTGIAGLEGRPSNPASGSVYIIEVMK